MIKRGTWGLMVLRCWVFGILVTSLLQYSINLTFVNFKMVLVISLIFDMLLRVLTLF